VLTSPTTVAAAASAVVVAGSIASAAFAFASFATAKASLHVGMVRLRPRLAARVDRFC